MNAPTQQALESAGVWKAWVLLCVAEAARMGLTPVATSQLHVILYLANTLADLFDVNPIRGRVLKKGPYPFYPDVQGEVDRMAFSGVLSIQRVDFGAKGRLAAHYALGREGRRIYESMLAHAPDAQRTARLFRELVAACFGRFLAARADIGPIDANYGDSNVLEGEVVDFGEWREKSNKNSDLAHYLIEQLKAMRPNAERDGVRLYCDYLDKALALA